MSYKTKNFIVITTIIWPLALIFLAANDKLLFDGYMTGQTGFARFLILALAGLILAAITVLYSYIFVPATKANVAIYTELEDHGLTDRFIQLAEAEVNRLISTGKVYKSYRSYQQYVCLIANAYINKGNIPTAIDRINTVTLSDIATYLRRSSDSRFILGYYDVQMDICEKLNDPQRADSVMQGAGPYLEKTANGIITDKLMNYEIYCLYYLTHDDIDNALVYANKCLSLGDHETIFFISYALTAKCYIRAKQFDKALEYINMLQSRCKKGLHKHTVGSLRANYEKALAAYNSGC